MLLVRAELLGLVLLDTVPLIELAPLVKTGVLETILEISGTDALSELLATSDVEVGMAERDTVEEIIELAAPIDNTVELATVDGMLKSPVLELLLKAVLLVEVVVAAAKGKDEELAAVDEMLESPLDNPLELLLKGVLLLEVVVIAAKDKVVELATADEILAMLLFGIVVAAGEDKAVELVTIDDTLESPVL